MADAKRAVIFDFDGVVADSWQAHEDCWRKVVADHGQKLPDEILAKVIGLSSMETAKKLTEEIDLKIEAEALATEKDQRFTDQIPTLPPMPGAARAVTRLAEDFVVGIIAQREREAVEAALDRFNVAGFEVLVTRDQLKAGQEFDELLALATKEIEVAPEKCALVDDSRHGILAAKKAGFKTIAYASNPKHEIDFSMADAEIVALDALVPELVNQVIAA